VHPVHGSTVDRPFKRRGTRSVPSVQDLTTLDARVRDAAASTPECGGARWELAGVSPGRRSRPPLRPRLVENDAGTLAHVFVGFMGAIVPHRRPAPEGGGASAPASSWARGCARREGKLGGVSCSQFKGEAGELKDEEDSTAAGFGNGGRTGGAPAWTRRDTHGLRGREPAAN
jgi:hypothetical protein